MEATLKELNNLVSAGVLASYAIGGAVAALYYLEPFMTEDLDVFCLVPPSASPFMPFAEIYEALKTRGYSFEGEFLVVEGIPVQFLPASTPLEVDALAKAANMPYGSGGVMAPVIRAEYLLAIALQTGRDKDYERISRLLIQVKNLDVKLVRDLINRYNLNARADVFRRRYEETAKLLDA